MTASISSMSKMQGARPRARSKRLAHLLAGLTDESGLDVGRACSNERQLTLVGERAGNLCLAGARRTVEQCALGHVEPLRLERLQMLRKDSQSVRSRSRMSSGSINESQRAPSSTDSLLALVDRLSTSRHNSSVIAPPCLLASVQTSLARRARLRPDIPVVAWPRNSGMSAGRSIFSISRRRICNRSGAPGRSISTAVPNRDTIASSIRSRRLAGLDHPDLLALGADTIRFRKERLDQLLRRSVGVRASAPGEHTLALVNENHAATPATCLLPYLFDTLAAAADVSCLEIGSLEGEEKTTRGIGDPPGNLRLARPWRPVERKPGDAALSPRLNKRILSRISAFTSGLSTMRAQIFSRSVSLTSRLVGPT